VSGVSGDQRRTIPRPSDAAGAAGVVLEEVVAVLDAAERALEQIADGTHGRCEVCGEVLAGAPGDTADAAVFVTRCGRHTGAAPG